MTRYRRIFWNEEASGPRTWAAPLLWPASLAYRCAAAGWAFAAGFRGVRSLPVPVVSVGNLVAGGTGKTPMALWIARELLRAGRKPAILLRGYGGHAGAGPLVVSDGEAVLCDYACAGDESVMVARRAAGVSVLAGSDRFRTGLHAVGHLGCDCIVLDDGFQYLGLHRDLDLLLMDSSRPFGNGRLLPAGTLREPRGAASRADLIVFTRWDRGGGGESERERALGISGARGFVAASHRFAGLSPAFGEEALGGHEEPAGRGERNDREASERKPREAQAARKSSIAEGPKRLPALLVSGIAGAASFQDMIVSEGYDVRGHLRYADHHRYGAGDAARIKESAARLGAAIVITTEKDAVRLPREAAGLDIPFYAAAIELRIEKGLDLLREALESLFESASAPLER